MPAAWRTARVGLQMNLRALHARLEQKNKPAKQTTDKLLLYTVRSAKGVQR